MYYFVETQDKIADAFADCLGGLLSVAAQNLKLRIHSLSPTCTIAVDLAPIGSVSIDSLLIRIHPTSW